MIEIEEIMDDEESSSATITEKAKRIANAILRNIIHHGWAVKEDVYLYLTDRRTIFIASGDDITIEENSDILTIHNCPYNIATNIILQKKIAEYLQKITEHTHIVKFVERMENNLIVLERR